MKRSTSFSLSFNASRRGSSTPVYASLRRYIAPSTSSLLCDTLDSRLMSSSTFVALRISFSKRWPSSSTSSGWVDASASLMRSNKGITAFAPIAMMVGTIFSSYHRRRFHRYMWMNADWSSASSAVALSLTIQSLTMSTNSAICQVRPFRARATEISNPTGLPIKPISGNAVSGCVTSQTTGTGIAPIIASL